MASSWSAVRPRGSVLSGLFHPAPSAFPARPNLVPSRLPLPLPHPRLNSPRHRHISSLLPPSPILHAPVPTPAPPPVYRHTLFALALGSSAVLGAALYTSLDADGRIQRRKEAMGYWFSQGGASRGLDLGLARERALEVRARAVAVVRRFPES